MQSVEIGHCKYLQEAMLLQKNVERMRKISESIAHRVISAYLELVGLGNHCQQGAQQRELGLQQGSAERPGLWERLWVPLQMHNTCMHAS